MNDPVNGKDPADGPANGTRDDDALHRLLHETVASVTPRDGLAEIRRRTRRPVRRARRWAPIVLGAGVATAVVVAGSVAIGRIGAPDPGEGDPASRPSTSSEPTHRAAALYFLGDTPAGTRLFREFRSLPAHDDAGDAVEEALAELEPGNGPADADYWTAWPADSFAGVEVGVDAITVTLGDRRALARPGKATTRDARLGIQQVVYTAEAGVGDALPVLFEWNDRPARRVLGIAVRGAVERDRQYDVTAAVNISDPVEGLEVDDTLVVTGTHSDLADRVTWELRGPEPAWKRIAHGIAKPADDDAPLGAPAWETGPIDVSDLEPGEYELTVQTRIVGQTSGVIDFHTDTRTIVVR